MRTRIKVVDKSVMIATNEGEGLLKSNKRVRIEMMNESTIIVINEVWE